MRSANRIHRKIEVIMTGLAQPNVGTDWTPGSGWVPGAPLSQRGCQGRSHRTSSRAHQLEREGQFQVGPVTGTETKGIVDSWEGLRAWRDTGKLTVASAFLYPTLRGSVHRPLASPADLSPHRQYVDAEITHGCRAGNGGSTSPTRKS